MNKQKGQVILILVLIMTVALAIGISVIQRSLSDISTSSKVEQSSRAFSAAEAGIERVLQGGLPNISFSENGAEATVNDKRFIPCIPGSTVDCSAGQQGPLEYPPLAKEETAHVWLSDFTAVNNPPPPFYDPPTNTLDVYWGSPGALDIAALELTVIYYDGDQYLNQKNYYDQISRTPANNFTFVSPSTGSCAGNFTLGSSGVIYQCKQVLTLPSAGDLMILRARLLYNTTSQPFAVQAVGTCATCYLPPQARNITSTGIAGQTQRKINLFQVNNVVAPYFDYAIFSAGSIDK